MGVFVDYYKTKELVFQIFEKAGLKKEYAATVADNLLEAEARGIRSHGLVQVNNYVKMVDNGEMITDGVPEILKDDISTYLIDGKHLPGSVTGKFAFKKTIEKAKKTGICVTAVKGCTHFGMAAYYAMDALEENMIGLAFCSAGTLVAPFGGYTRQLGTNPICVVVPAKKNKPIVFDAATSVQAFNKVFFAKTEGRSIPIEWAMDENGNETTDPNLAINGALNPFGGYKGYGLAVIINILCGFLSGASIVKAEDDSISEDTQEIGFNFAAIDISHFQDVEEFKEGIDIFIDRLKNSPAKAGQDIKVPGEIEFANKELALNEGIELFNGVREILTDLSTRLNTDLRFDDIIVK